MIKFICGSLFGIGIMSAFSVLSYKKGFTDGKWEQEYSNFLQRCGK